MTRTRTTILLCCLAAAFEGIDLQSMGIAAPGIRAELQLSASQFGTAASMSLGGLLVGAVLGGRASDIWGRRLVLVAAMIALGAFSLLTTRADGYHPLLVIRFLVGLGLGGAFPTLIAIVAEAVGGPRRTLPLSLMYAGLPLGTVVGTLIVLHFGKAFEWRWIFYLGGIGPLLLALPLLLGLPAGRVPIVAGGTPRLLPTPVREVLFAARRATPTLLLWLAFFFTLLVIYLLTNWLNQLIVGRGFSPVQATVVLLSFGLGSVAGSIGLGAVLDAGHRRFTALVTYTGVAGGLAALALLHSYPLLILAAAVTGFCAVGAQLINYAMAPAIYPTRMRGTGVGWTVAVGRTGSFFGPLIGGAILQAGYSAATVLLMFVPTLIVAALASTAMLRDDRIAHASPGA